MSTIRVQPDRVLPIGTTERRRTFRVVALAAGLVIFGLGDLYSTILHSVHVGIHEVNPIGAYLISEQSLAKSHLAEQPCCLVPVPHNRVGAEPPDPKG